MIQVDTKHLKWIHKPQRYIVSDDKIILETEPFTDFTGKKRGAEAIQIQLFEMRTFCFTIRVDFSFSNPFDQCGIVIYEGEKRKMICDVKHHNETVDEIECIVFHEGYGDKSLREIGTAIEKMYFRIIYRGGNILVQYSFQGKIFTDLRLFHVHTDHPLLKLGIYACSPRNSSFNCTFSNMTLLSDREEDYDNVK